MSLNFDSQIRLGSGPQSQPSADDCFFMGMYAATMGAAAWGIANTPRRLTLKGREEYLKI